MTPTAPQKERPPFRVCAHCGRDHGREGPRPPGSALKLVQGEMTYACSPGCVEALGWGKS